MRVTAAIRNRLSDAFHPERLEVIDESALHAGHAGARPGGETHFRVVVVAEAFRGLSAIARQRQIYRALDDLMADRIHALAIDARTPAEPRES